MSDRPDAAVTKIRFSLICAAISAFVAVFGHGMQRWAGIVGVFLWLTIAKLIDLKNRLPRRRTPADPS